MVFEVAVYTTAVVGFSFPTLSACANCVRATRGKSKHKNGGCMDGVSRRSREAALCFVGCIGKVTGICKATSEGMRRPAVVNMCAEQIHLQSRATVVAGAIRGTKDICISDQYIFVGDAHGNDNSAFKDIVPLGGMRVKISGDSVTLDAPMQLRFSSAQEAANWGARFREAAKMENPAVLIQDLNAQLLTKTMLIKEMALKMEESRDAEATNGTTGPNKADYAAYAAIMAEDEQKDLELARMQNELKALQTKAADLQQERARLEGKLGTLEASSARSAAALAAAREVPSPNPATQPSQLQTPPPRPASSRSGSENYPWSRAAASATTTPREPLGGASGVELSSFQTSRPAIQSAAPLEERWAPAPPSSAGVLRKLPATAADRTPTTPTNVYTAPATYSTVYASPTAASRELSQGTKVARQRSAPAVPTGSKPDEGFSSDLRALVALCDANPALKTMWFLNEATIENVSQWPGVTCSERGNTGRVFGLKLNVKVLPESIGLLTALLTLDLSNCYELTAIPEAIGNLRSLTTLKLMSCANVQRLPESIGNLSELKTLSLGGCEKLATLPSRLGDMQALRQLDLWRCSSLVRVPDSIGNLQRLEKLKLMRCSSLTALPERMGDLRALTMIDLWECSSLVALPNRLGDLMNLTKLDLRGCTALKKESSGSLSRLRARNCEIVFEALKSPDSHPASVQSFARSAGR